MHKLFFSDRELFWVIIACIMPDIPWILLRGGLAIPLADPYALRLYTSTQASLLFCLVLSAAVSQCSRQQVRAFLLLSTNCLIHLLLDATQIKWGNGVHLLVPFNWSLLQLNLFTTEHPLGIFITICGIGVLLWVWPKIARQQAPPPEMRRGRIITFIICLAAYLAGPFLFFNELERSDFYYLHTLRDRNSRPGKYIEFDRVPYSGTQQAVLLFTGESINLKGDLPRRSGTISVQGRFLTADTVQVSHHQHHGRIRDLASMLGIFLACVLTLQTLILSRFPFIRSQKGHIP